MWCMPTIASMYTSFLLCLTDMPTVGEGMGLPMSTTWLSMPMGAYIYPYPKAVDIIQQIKLTQWIKLQGHMRSCCLKSTSGEATGRTTQHRRRSARHVQRHENIIRPMSKWEWVITFKPIPYPKMWVWIWIRMMVIQRQAYWRTCSEVNTTNHALCHQWRELVWWNPASTIVWTKILARRDIAQVCWLFPDTDHRETIAAVWAGHTALTISCPASVPHHQPNFFFSFSAPPQSNPGKKPDTMMLPSIDHYLLVSKWSSLFIRR